LSQNTISKEKETMHSSVVSRWLFIFLALLMFVSCNRGGKIESDKAKSAKSATKTAVTSTVRADSVPKGTTSNKTTAKKTDSKKDDFDFNGITQFHER
jgi:hypothetical protein